MGEGGGDREDEGTVFTFVLRACPARLAGKRQQREEERGRPCLDEREATGRFQFCVCVCRWKDVEVFGCVSLWLHGLEYLCALILLLLCGVQSEDVLMD